MYIFPAVPLKKTGLSDKMEQHSEGMCFVMAEQPKYLMVADTLRREIAEGLFLDGQKLMTEETLRDRFGVSRQTVRQAIALLEDDGLVDRQRGSGTYARASSASGW